MATQIHLLFFYSNMQIGSERDTESIDEGYMIFHRFPNDADVLPETAHDGHFPARQQMLFQLNEGQRFCHFPVLV